ncbi:MAG: hypothetical protein R2695_20540 [Acidimicrobiales bacterium]
MKIAGTFQRSIVAASSASEAAPKLSEVDEAERRSRMTEAA